MNSRLREIYLFLSVSCSLFVIGLSLWGLLLIVGY